MTIPTQPKTLPKLNDIAECGPRFFNLDTFNPGAPGRSGGDFTYIEPQKFGLPTRLASLPIVTAEFAGKGRPLLAVLSIGGVCELVPMFLVGDSFERLNRRDFRRMVGLVDGWLVGTQIDGHNPQIRLSVIRKQKWVTAGKPLVLDAGPQGKPVFYN